MLKGQTQKKTRTLLSPERLHEHFRKVRANFSLLHCDIIRSAAKFIQTKLVQRSFFVLGGFLGGGIFSSEYK